MSSWGDLSGTHVSAGQEARKEAGSLVLVREDKAWAGMLESPSRIFIPALVAEENYPHFTSRKLRPREPMELAQDHTARE